ncbi:TrkA family potassium uptake protein [Streptomyces californicus]
MTIIRGMRATPSTEETLEAGDELLFVAAQAREEQLEDLLSVRNGPDAESTPRPRASED